VVEERFKNRVSARDPVSAVICLPFSG